MTTPLPEEWKAMERKFCKKFYISMKRASSVGGYMSDEELFKYIVKLCHQSYEQGKREI